MPDAVGFSQIAERFQKFKIHGLLIVGGFEVSFTFGAHIFCALYIE